MRKSTKPSGYAHTIASRKELLDLLSNAKKPLSFVSIVKKLKYQNESGKQDGIERRLNAMVREGQLIKNRKECYGVSSEMNLVVGRVQGHSEGFGFLVPKDGGGDLFIHFRQMSQVMHGDTVLAHKVMFKGKAEAKIIEVLEHANQTLVAKYIEEDGVSEAIPVNTRIQQTILIPSHAKSTAKNNEMVILEITKQPNKRFGPVGKVIEVLGSHLDPGMEIDVAMHAWGIPHTWNQEVLDFADKISTNITKNDFADRRDLTSTPLVTIDGEDSKDFDDAVWCEPTDNGWRALVAIADVSHYVPSGSVLDDEAINRTTSVYFPEFVVPMLPESLSNGICSLNPDVNRYAMVCEMFINKKGEVENYNFFDAVIKSHARLTYTQVGALFEPSPEQSAQDLLQKLPFLKDLYNLYNAFSKARKHRGALDFERTETKIIFNENRKISAVEPVIRNDAHKLIEEMMVAANVCAGKLITKYKIPSLFRVHETPNPVKLTALREFLTEFTLTLEGGDKPTSKDYAAVLAAAKQKPEFDLIQSVCLRSMNRAVYSPDNLGHFGLAHEVYAHFTSPIRRYPDLLVHRAIRHLIENKPKTNGSFVARAISKLTTKKPHKTYQYSPAKMVEFGITCSTNERRADDATRDVMDWLKCEYMQDKVGQTFKGKVASVTSFGLFVRLDNIHIDGLLHISMLEEGYYNFNADHYRLESEHKTYGIGDTLEVLVARVDLDERKIEFALENSPPPRERKPKRRFGKDFKKGDNKSGKKPFKKNNPKSKSNDK